jgi:CzcA family heavy metal efflux pump
VNTLFDAVIRGSIKNRYLVLLGAVVLIVVGVWSARGAHLDALPDFAPPLVVVQAEARGLGSSDVERLVTTPLEQSLLGVPDVTRVRSTTAAGLSVIQLTFEDGVDIFRARQLVGERLVEARARLPATLPAPRLAPITAPVGALLRFCYTDAREDPTTLPALWRFAQWKVEPRLAAINGVARVTVHGGAAQRIEVRPDPAEMLARGVTLEKLRRSLEDAQSLAPLGRVESGSQQQPLRAAGIWSWGNTSQIGNTAIATRNGLPVRVADVAQVAPGAAPAVGAALYNGQPAICLQVDKLPWADTVQVTGRVESALGKLDAELPPGARRRPPSFRQADFIHTSLGELARDMAIGAVLVIFILVAFLRSPRLAIISLTALPLSIVAAATVLLLCGVTINGMILGGLAVAIGEVVDDAIVDVENIWRRLQQNAHRPDPLPALQVIHDASAEVRGAVVYASLIVVAVLTPVIILGGLAGRIFSPLAQAYALAVAASLIVALTVTPALAALLLPAFHKLDARETWLAGLLRRGYSRTLDRVSRTPGRVLLGAVVLGVAALVALPLLGGAFLPDFHAGVLIAELRAAPGTSIEQTTRLAARVDTALRHGAGLPRVVARVGRAALDEDAAPVNRVEMDLVLPPGRDPDAVGADIRRRLAQLPGVESGVDGFLGERINEVLSGERAPIAVKFYGDDLHALRSAARALIPQLSRVPGVEEVRSPGLTDAPTLDLHIDDARLDIAGVRRAGVVDGAATWRQGLHVADENVPGGFSVPVVVAGEHGLRTPNRLADLPISTARSCVLPLSALVKIENGAEPAIIHHEGGRRVVTVTARPRSRQLSNVAEHIERLMARAQLPAGTSWKLAGQAAERRQASAELAVTVGLVLAAIFAFLWLAFGSLVDAGVVLGGLPLGLAGGVAAALLLPEGLSMAGLVGFVTLAGIISRNGIMLVSHKNQLRAASPDSAPDEVVLQAARERLLPILMTAAAAFFGLLPLAASMGRAGSELEAPMAFIVCGGLLSSTALNLFAVPAFYLWRQRRRARRSRPVV